MLFEPILVECFANFESTVASMALSSASTRRALERPAVRPAGIAETITDIAALRRLGPEWTALQAAGTAPLAFQSFAFVTAFAESAEDMRIVVVRDGGAPRLIVPLAVTRSFGVRVAHWLGEPIAQYGDVLACPRARPEHAEAALGAMRSWHDVDAVSLRRVRSDSAFQHLFGEALRSQGCDQSAPFIDLEPYTDLEDYQARCSAHGRRRRRSDRRKLAGLGALSFEVLSGPAALPAFDHAMALKRAWLDERSLVSPVVHDAAMCARLREIVAAPAGGGAVSVLRVGSRVAAVEIGFAAGRHYCSYLGATEPDLARYGPGKLQMEDTIGWCIDNGYARYDLLAPADLYKLSWTEDAVAVCDHALILSLRGRVFLPLKREGLRRLKTAYARAPEGLRAVLARLAGLA